MQIITNQARVYINFGRVIADCPRDCGGAMQLQPGQPLFHCGECGHVCEIEWPFDLDDLLEALAERPADKFRNWFPSNHTLALRAGVPHGQTVRELEDETAEHMGV